MCVAPGTVACLSGAGGRLRRVMILARPTNLDNRCLWGPELFDGWRGVGGPSPGRLGTKSG